MADNIWNRELLLWKKRKESKPLESLLWAKETFNKKKKNPSSQSSEVSTRGRTQRDP